MVAARAEQNFQIVVGSMTTAVLGPSTLVRLAGDARDRVGVATDIYGQPNSMLLAIGVTDDPHSVRP